MSLLLYRLSHLCMRHRRTVLAAWVALLVGLIALVASVGAETSDNLTLPGTGSTEATDLLDRYLPEESNGTNPIVLEVTSGKLTDSANKKAIDSVVKAYQHEPGIEQVVAVHDAPDDRPPDDGAPDDGAPHHRPAHDGAADPGGPGRRQRQRG